jgi:hypothetical protein
MDATRPRVADDYICPPRSTILRYGSTLTSSVPFNRSPRSTALACESLDQGPMVAARVRSDNFFDASGLGIAYGHARPPETCSKNTLLLAI